MGNQPYGSSKWPYNLLMKHMAPILVMVALAEHQTLRYGVVGCVGIAMHGRLQAVPHLSLSPVFHILYSTSPQYTKDKEYRHTWFHTVLAALSYTKHGGVRSGLSASYRESKEGCLART